MAGSPFKGYSGGGAGSGGSPFKGEAGRTTGSGKAKDKGGKVQKKAELDKNVRKSEQLGVGDQAKQIASDKFVNPVLRALTLLDKPRAAVVGGLMEVSDALDDRADTKGSLGDIKEHVAKGTGFGDLLAKGGGTGNKWVDRGLGFAGDVALDPLTYLTLGASAVGKAGVSVGGKEVARRLAQKGMMDEADKVLRQGVKSLSKEGAQAADVRVGARFGVGQAKVNVPGGDAVARAIGKVTGPARGAVVDSKLAQKASKVFNTVPVPDNVAQGDQGRVKKLLFEDSYRAARNRAQGARHEGAAELQNLAGMFKDVDGRRLLSELEGQRTGDARAAEAAQHMRDWFNSMADRMDEVTGRSIGRREDYAPWMMTRQFKEMLGETGDPSFSRSGKQGFEKRRTKADKGATFFGEKLKGNAAQRRAQMERIAKENLGDDFQAFIDDPWELAQRYLFGAEKYMTNHGTVRQLADTALTKTPGTKVKKVKGAKKQKAAMAEQVAAFTRLAEDEANEAENVASVADAAKAHQAQRDDIVEQMKAAGLEKRRAANQAGWDAFSDEERLAKLAADPIVVPGVTFKEVPAEQFARAVGTARRIEKNGRKVGETVYQYKTSEYRGMKTFLSADGKTGYAVKPDGDLVSVFNVGQRGAGEAAVAGGIREGATKLDAFDESGFLPNKYGRLGFSETGREQWDPQYAPRGWKGEEPDVVYMEKTDDPAILQTEPDVAGKQAAVSFAEKIQAKTPERTPGADREKLVLAELERERRKWLAKGKKPWNKQQERTFRQYAEEAVDRKGPELEERITGLQAQLDEALEGRTVAAVYSPEQLDSINRLKDQLKTVGELENTKRARIERRIQQILDAPQTPARKADDRHIAALKVQIEQAKRELEGLTSTPNPRRAQAERAVVELKADLDHTMAEVDEIRRTNDAELRRIEQEVAATIGRRRAKLEEVADLRRQAKNLFDAVDREVAAGNQTHAAIAELEAVAADHAARAGEAGRKAIGLEEAMRKLRMTKTVADLGPMYEEGLKRFAFGQWAEPWVLDATKELAEFNARGSTGNFLKTFDWIQSRWKAYALLTPGFHFRNFMGGAFNNSLANVAPSAYTKFARAHRQFEKGGLEAIADGDVRKAYGEMVQRGVLGEGNVRDVADISNGATGGGGLLGAGLRKVDPTSLDNAVLGLNRSAGTKVETLLRGPLFVDRMLKGFSADEAMEAVAKYHFDYDDLSRFERDVLKRVVPFYTWTRKNFPLQIESMLQQPGKYTRFVHAKRNIESGTEEEETTPKYFGSLMAIRTPFKTKNGDTMYYTPDLPFRDLAEQFSVGTMLGQVSPLIRTPIESATKQKTYEEFVPMSDRLQPAPMGPGWGQVVPVLEKMGGKYGLPKVHKRDDGTYLMEEAQLHKVDSLIPLLAKLRRIAPSEDKYQERQITTAISMLTGHSMLTNTDSAQAGELARRVREVMELNKKKKALSDDTPG